MAPRSSKGFLKSLIFLLTLVLFTAFFWWRWAISPVQNTTPTSQIFVIPKGQAIDTIGLRLQKAGLIRSKTAFKILVLKEGLATKIQAGDFRLNNTMDLVTLSQQLTHGTIDIWVTLLEGWRLEEIAQEINSQFQKKGSQFDAKTFVSLAKNQEGYLFPDTYLLPRELSPIQALNLFKNTFSNKVNLETNKSGLTDKQVIILASIIEREVNTDKDRSIIAGILIKRLQNNWALQADATVQYLNGSRNCSLITPDCKWWSPQITKADLKINSPYNTYLNQGLPPAPIANPGLASINAVLSPQASNYWFYISDPSSKIHYAKDLQGHNQNISKYLTKK